MSKCSTVNQEPGSDFCHIGPGRTLNFKSVSHAHVGYWESMEYVVSCFDFLLRKPGQRQQRYTCNELADEIEKHYDVVNGSKKLAWVVGFLRENGNVVLVINNF